MTKPDDIGNTLLRGTDGSEVPPAHIPPAKAMQIINDALKPCPEIDATTQDMANQAEQAYEVLAQYLHVDPAAFSLMDLVNKIIGDHKSQTFTLECKTALLGKICDAMDLTIFSTGPEIIAEVENIARLAQRNIEFDKLPYVVITHVHSEEISDLAKAKRKAESVANHSSEGHAAIARVVASVKLQPVWSDRT